MVKEHLIEEYGVPRYVIGLGASGGGWNQHVIAEEYPGLLDGIVPEAPFPDFLSLIYNEQADCQLIVNYLSANSTWGTSSQQSAVTGDGYGACQTEALIGPTQYTPDNTAPLQGIPNVFGCDPSTPPENIYDPITNPGGARCTYQDDNVNLLGRRPPSSWTAPERAIGRGFANRMFDNVGVQYGLATLNAGRITQQQFVDLNANVGGIDIDGNLVAQRSTADHGALIHSYQNDILTSGIGLRQTPIIEIPIADNTESSTVGGHLQQFVYILRARLLAANGTAANQVIFTCALCGFLAVEHHALLQMDQWLSNIAADSSHAPRPVKVIRDRPDGLSDECWGPSTQTSLAACRELAPLAGLTRTVAGESFRYDVLKCQLKPLKRADYDVTFTAAQWATLENTFPTGVCDYTKPGVDQQAPIGQWLSYADGPTGIPLPPPPESVRFPGAPARK
jgi:Tannase-like family of unknown function (DUF6351)